MHEMDTTCSWFVEWKLPSDVEFREKLSKLSNSSHSLVVLYFAGSENLHVQIYIDKRNKKKKSAQLSTGSADSRKPIDSDSNHQKRAN